MRKSDIVDRIIRKIKKVMKPHAKGRKKIDKNPKKKTGKKKTIKQRGGGVAGEILTGVETVTQDVANALMALCGKSSGGTGGDIGTLAQDLIGTVENISCATGQGLNLMDNLLELPANLGTAYRDPGAPGASLS
jgi:hypothetical protein